MHLLTNSCEEGLEIQTICQLTVDKFGSMRTSNGKLYSGDLKRSVKCALTSNGVFEQLKTGNYRVNLENAKKWENQTREKFEAQKRSYEQKRRKYQIKIGN